MQTTGAPIELVWVNGSRPGKKTSMSSTAVEELVRPIFHVGLLDAAAAAARQAHGRGMVEAKQSAAPK